MAVPLSLGLMLAPFGGHTIFPTIKRDMRHDCRYTESLIYTYAVAMPLFAGIAVVGKLMFGSDVKPEITANILLSKDYPKSISLLITASMSIIAITKAPLTARPVFSIIESFLGLESNATVIESEITKAPPISRKTLRKAVKIITVLVVVMLAILVPDFKRIMAFLGAALVWNISVSLPTLFYLKLLNFQIPKFERIICYSIIIIGIISSVAGTLVALLPKRMIFESSS